MLIVAALGGNALLQRGEAPTIEAQRRNLATAAAALAEIARQNRIVVTHGNGPQIGLLALQAEAPGIAGRWPMDVLGAETEGMLGYLIEQELGNALGAEVAALLTRVEIDPGDPAFLNPDKPVGPVYDRETAERLANARDWRIGPDGAASCRLRCQSASWSSRQFASWFVPGLSWSAVAVAAFRSPSAGAAPPTGSRP